MTRPQKTSDLGALMFFNLFLHGLGTRLDSLLCVCIPGNGRCVVGVYCTAIQCEYILTMCVFVCVAVLSKK